MSIHILGNTITNFRDLLIAFSKLYRDDPRPPHSYLVYDLLYEPENTEVIARISSGRDVESYVLIWRSSQVYAVHLWGGSDSCDLLNYMVPEPRRFTRLVVELYNDDEELIRCVVKHLVELGFRKIDVRRYHDMVCTEEMFKPSENEYLATKLSHGYAELFRDYMRFRGIELSLQEARDLLMKKIYYGVIIGNEIVSAGAICTKLPEIYMVCDVYTKPSFRGRGYAKAVVSAITRIAITSNAKAWLNVEIGNEPAIKVYTKLGYRVVDTRPWVIAYP